MENHIMNIFTAFNDGYVLPTKVMFKSLILSNPVPMTVYVFYGSLRQESIDAIRQMEEPGRVSFVFRQVDDSFLQGFTIPQQFSKETYYRLFAHRIFPEDVDRALWLDGDMIINGSLVDFYEQDFQGKTFVAVENGKPFYRFNEDMKAILKMPPESKYINSGVMLFNLKQARETLDTEAILRYITEHQEILRLADQDVFNGLLHDHILVADPERRYNFFHTYVTEENKAAIYREARIIHYCGVTKPWKEDYALYASDLWWKYALWTGPEYLELFDAVKCGGAAARRLEAELDAVRQSGSYRLGRVLTWLPRKAIGFVRCIREHGFLYTLRRALVRLHLLNDSQRNA